jgi:hypothetical protein
MRLRIGNFTLDDPDDVGQSEYRALYDLLSDVADDQEDAAFSIAVLKEVKRWCDSLIEKLSNSAKAEGRDDA